MSTACQDAYGYNGSLQESFAEAGLHLGHHYGVSFGLGIIPLSFIIFLVAILYLMFKNKETANEKPTPDFEKNIFHLEALMKNKGRR